MNRTLPVLFAAAALAALTAACSSSPPAAPSTYTLQTFVKTNGGSTERAEGACQVRNGSTTSNWDVNVDFTMREYTFPATQVTCAIQKQGGGNGELFVLLKRNGVTISSDSTTAPYGNAGVSG